MLQRSTLTVWPFGLSVCPPSGHSITYTMEWGQVRRLGLKDSSPSLFRDYSIITFCQKMFPKIFPLFPKIRLSCVHFLLKRYLLFSEKHLALFFNVLLLPNALLDSATLLKKQSMSLTVKSQDAGSISRKLLMTFFSRLGRAMNIQNYDSRHNFVEAGKDGRSALIPFLDIWNRSWH